jgi:hypothetical protein
VKALPPELLTQAQLQYSGAAAAPLSPSHLIGFAVLSYEIRAARTQSRCRTLISDAFAPESTARFPPTRGFAACKNSAERRLEGTASSVPDDGLAAGGGPRVQGRKGCSSWQIHFRFSCSQSLTSRMRGRIWRELTRVILPQVGHRPPLKRGRCNSSTKSAVNCLF